MDTQQKTKTIKYWRDGAVEALDLMDLVLSKGHYSHALFCGHLAIEKILKAIVINRTDRPAPMVHELLYLVGLAKIDMDIVMQDELTAIQRFNIAGRYPEDKEQISRTIDKAFASDWAKKIKRIYQWLSKLNGKS